MGTTRSQRILTAQDLVGLKPGEWVSDPAERGAGRFQARGLSGGGVVFYYRFTNSLGKRERIAIGPFDAAGRKGLTLADARAKARELSRRYLAGDRDLRAEIAAELESKRASREAAEQAKRDAEEAAKQRAAASLGALLTAYCDQLERDGKKSTDHVRRALKRHVETAHPKLWALPAADVSTDDLFDVLAPLAQAGKDREAGKVRAYLRAAFAAGCKARHDARALPALRALKLTTNPARDLATITPGTNARERALSLAELRAYWKRISALPAPWGPLLRIHILTGGQRVEQLARATLADLDRDTATLTLWDAKGRRQQPRRHVVPLLTEALTALDALRTGKRDGKAVPASAGDYIFTASNGSAPASYSGCAAAVREVAAAMAKERELDEGKGPFTIGDLRRTVETRLAAAGVSLDVRAQLQSHGLGGLQAKHYDRHGYLDEKRTALEKLRELLTRKAATVTRIGKRRVSAAK
jgi:hypothetical protein